MNLPEYSNNSTQNTNYYAQASSSELSPTKQDTVEANNTLDLIVIGTIFFVTISFVLWRLCFQKASTNIPQVFEKSSQNKCTKCRFFDNNHYLKCAVHPSTVLKKEAQDCWDYEPGLETNIHSEDEDIRSNL